MEQIVASYIIKWNSVFFAEMEMKRYTFLLPKERN